MKSFHCTKALYWGKNSSHYQFNSHLFV